MLSTLPPWVFDWSGHLGVALQAGVIRGRTYIYALLNLLAASFVLISLSVAFNLSSALIQVFWIAISLGGLARLIWLSSGLRFSPEDKALITQVFGPMPKPLARPARLFTITSGALNRLIRRYRDLRLLVENAMSRDTRAKLVAANQRLSTARKGGL